MALDISAKTRSSKNKLYKALPVNSRIIHLTNNKADPYCFLLSGIMTLPSSPCEIENMSLFQDLKLKRRKVDSRCSSDGKKGFEDT